MVRALLDGLVLEVGPGWAGIPGRDRLRDGWMGKHGEGLDMNASSRVRRLSWTFSMLLGVSMMASAWSQARLDEPPSVHDAAPAWMDYRAAERIGFFSSPSAPAPESSDICALLVEAIVQVESAGNAKRVGHRGERGLMQVKSGTWAEMTVKMYGSRLSFERAFEPSLNRQVGLAYLRQLRDFLHEHRERWGGDERSLLLACYNAGPGRVRESGFQMDLLPSITRDYVQRATALHESLLSERAPQAADAMGDKA